MAGSKEAPISDICITSAECRQALEQSVQKFAETFESVPKATIRRRLKESKVEIEIVPNGHHKTR